MARAATTSDAFNAIAEPQRRDILVLLRDGERPVTEVARDLGMSQPQASKHLRVLREVGLVEVRDDGRRRLYRLDAVPLKPIHDWVRGFEQLWSERFDRMDVVLEELMEAEKDDEQRDGNEPAQRDRDPAGRPEHRDHP